MDERQKHQQNYNRKWVSAKRRTLTMMQNEHIADSYDSNGDSYGYSTALNNEEPQCDHDNVLEDRCLFTDPDGGDVDKHVWDVLLMGMVYFRPLILNWKTKYHYVKV